MTDEHQHALEEILDWLAMIAVADVLGEQPDELPTVDDEAGES